MESKLMKSELLYIEEHLSCQNYMTTIETGFKYLEFNKNTEIEEDNTSKNYLLFFLKGRFHHNLQPVPQQTVSCRRDDTHPTFFPAEGNWRKRFKPALHVFRYARRKL